MSTFTITTGDPGRSFTVTGNITITENDPIVVAPPPPPIDTTGFKVGANGFPWMPIKLLQSIGMKWVRCYVASGWIWRPNGLFIQPMFQAETQETHGIDDYLQHAKEMGVNPLLCIHQTPEWYRNTGRSDGNNDYAPLKSGARRDNPASYKDYASFLFQVAARYGRVKHPDSALKIDTTPRWNSDLKNEKKTGLDLLSYIEPWNEPDKWWKLGTSESEAYLMPEEAAALMSACYDGHEGTMGPGVGIKTADPSMIVVMPGLSDFADEYAVKIGAWFTKNRKDQKWPCDILNYHHYSNLGNKKGQYPAQWVDKGSCSPKNDANFSYVNDFVAHGIAIGKKVWITEFGADKVAPSMMLAEGSGKSNEQFQSDIIIESIKAYKDAGVDAVFVFNGIDDYGADDGGQFETCGIFSSQATGYKPFIAAKELKAYLASKKVEYVSPFDRGVRHKASEFKVPFKKSKQ